MVSPLPATPATVQRLFPSREDMPYLPLASRATVVTALQDWLASGTAGMALLTGDRASGRTRLLEQVVLWLADHDDRLIGVITGSERRRTDAGLLREAIGALGQQPTGRTGLDLTRELRGIAADHRTDAAPPVLLIDDADLTGSQLEILASVFGEDDTTLQVLLVGPSELTDRMLRRPRFSNLVRLQARVEPLTGTEIDHLLDGWLAAAREGAAGLPGLSNGARQSIINVAAGRPGVAFDLLQASLVSSMGMGAREVGAGLTDAIAATMPHAPAARSRNRPPASGQPTVRQTTMHLPGFDVPAEGSGDQAP